MKIVIAPDKFKGSLSAVEAARAFAQGVKDAVPDADVVVCPMADGGEGTVEAVREAVGADLVELKVDGPLPGQRVEACWARLPVGALSDLPAGGCLDGLLSPAGKTAVIEMAQASGLWFVEDGSRDPLRTTTYGTGELIAAALKDGCRQVIVGVGGSATVDGGTGMATALGYRFLDGRGDEVPRGGGALRDIRSIDSSGIDPGISQAGFLVASDVENPLVGDEGAARVYGPQKGATREQVDALDEGLSRLGELIGSQLGIDVLEMPGAGAAGGLGAGLVAFCGAKIVSGAGLVSEVVGLEKKIEGASLVLTGEGRVDPQTAYGKTPAGVVEIARRKGVPAIVIAGELSGDLSGLTGPGVAAYSVVPGPIEIGEALCRAGELVRSGTSRLMQIIMLGPIE